MRAREDMIPEDAARRAAELREQLQQMKSQMMKMRKDQGGANAEQG